MNKKEVILEFKKYLNEYINLGSTIDEVGEDETNQQPMGQNAPPMGGDANMGAPDMADPSMGMDAGQEPPMGDTAMAPNADMGGEQQGPEGFNPQGVDQTTGIDGMGGQEQGVGEMPQESDEEVIDVDDLTKSQEKTEDKIDNLNDKFSKLIDTINSIDKKIESVNIETEKHINSLKDELEKRNPSPMQRMTMRSVKSTPYNMTTDEYMNNYAPDNYSPDSDNNGSDDPQYKITRNDVDGWSDYASIERELDGKRSLRDILGF